MHGPDFSALDPCVHCGFCLPACPTYLATGDESDSPRGRIVLMRALERGELTPADADLHEHLDRCLGCRGCEPACPSGVGYGRGLASARELLAQAAGIPRPARAMLAVFGRVPLWRAAFGAARALRGSGLAGRFAGPSGLGRLLRMVAASRMDPRASNGRVTPRGASPRVTAPSSESVSARGRVALFRGCIMDQLFAHVHAATRRTLQANGYEVVEPSGQGCCGAVHEHAGDVHGARRLAARNVAALADGADFIVVNSAGCGAMLREYDPLLGTDAARKLSERTRDVTELLADAGPRPGGALALDVAYDAPCHLQYAQRVHAAPLQVLRSIPGLRLQLLSGYDRCCGGAGAYSLLQPEFSAAVLADKVTAIRDALPALHAVATGNPGCIMQIGAGLMAAGVALPVLHPVELLDRSYQAGGVYP